MRGSLAFLLCLGAVQGSPCQLSRRPSSSSSSSRFSSPTTPAPTSTAKCRHGPFWDVLELHRLSSAASEFCSTFIEKTSTTWVTAHPTHTITAVVTDTETVVYDVSVTSTDDVTATDVLVQTSQVAVTSAFTVEDVVDETTELVVTDATAVATSVAYETVTSDATVYETETVVADFTTTDATVYSTVTATATEIITDFTVVDHFTTTVATSLITHYVKARGAPSPAGLDRCPSELIGFGASALSNACSCLVRPSTITKTSTVTDPVAIATVRSTLIASAGVTSTIVVPYEASVTVSVTSVDVETTTIDQTFTQTTTAIITITSDVTFSTGITLTSVATDDETLTASVTVTEVSTVDATVFADVTQTTTDTLDATATVTDEVDVTATSTVTSTTSIPAPSNGCSNLSNPYTAGYAYNLYCNQKILNFLPILVYNVPDFATCITKCTIFAATCQGVNYEYSNGACTIIRLIDSAPVADVGGDVAVRVGVRLS